MGKEKLAVHQSFQERGMLPDVQMPNFTPIQVPDATPSGKLITGQVAQNYLLPLIINLISDREIFHGIPREGISKPCLYHAFNIMLIPCF